MMKGGTKGTVNRKSLIRTVAVILTTAVILMCTLYTTRQKIPLNVPLPLPALQIQVQAPSSPVQTITHNKLVKQWIIIDGRKQHGSVDIKEVAGWNVLYFEDIISMETKERCKSCLFMDMDTAKTQPEIGSSDIQITSYLYVIRAGARWIYSTNSLTDLQDQVSGFFLEDTARGLLYTGEAMFDPNIHFGSKSVSNLTDRRRYISYQLGEYQTPLIQTKWRPDQLPAEVLSVTCTLPHAFVPAHLSPVFGIIGSLVHYRAFWAVGAWLTGSDATLVSKWQNVLLSRITASVGICAPPCKVSQIFSHKQFKTDGIPTSESVGQAKKSSFKPVAIQLFSNVVGDGSGSDIIRSWLAILEHVGYSFPDCCQSDKTVPKELSKHGHNVLHEPSVNKNLKYKDPFRTLCKDKYPTQHEWSNKRMTDIVLVIFISYQNFYSNVVYMDFLYKTYFAHVVYCGPGFAQFMKFHNTYPYPVTFVDALTTQGLNCYTCISAAIQMGFKVGGYLQMADDNLFNPWSVVDLPRNRVWFHEDLKRTSINSPKVTGLLAGEKDWHWWKSGGVGAPKLRKVMKRLKTINKNPFADIAERFLKQLDISAGYSDGGACYGLSDIIYLPAEAGESFRYVSRFMQEQSVFLEIAIPTLLCGSSDISRMVTINGTFLWGKRRLTDFAKVYNSNHTFIHAFKLSELKQPAVKKFYCTRYLVDYISLSKP